VYETVGILYVAPPHPKTRNTGAILGTPAEHRLYAHRFAFVKEH
jgi:hypothetical protein